MDENDKIAIQSVYLQIKSNIDAAEPPDYLSLTQLEKIKNTSKSWNQFLVNIMDHLDPIYHASINLRPLETPKPKIVPPQEDFSNKKILEMNKQTNPVSFPTFNKQPDISIGSKNSSFSKPGAQSAQGLLGPSMKTPTFMKNNMEMPPPQTNQKLIKESKVLNESGINEENERLYLENSNPNRNFSYNSSNQNTSFISNPEKNFLNEIVIKSKLERKINDYNFRAYNSNCIDMLNIGFNYFVKNLLNNLEKAAALEKNSDTLQGFLKNVENIPQSMKIIENQDVKKILMKKKTKPEQFKDINFSLLSAPNKMLILKHLETYDKDQQTNLEEKIRMRKFFEIYEEKPTKKIKKQTDESKDIYDILLKNKNEKARESDNQRKTAEDTSRTIDIFLGKSNPSKNNAEAKEVEKKLSIKKETSKQNENKKNSIEKLRITLKTLIYVLEHDPNYRKMPILLKAYMKQNY